MKERIVKILGDNRKDAVTLSVYANSVRNGLLDLRTLPAIVDSLKHFGKRYPTGEDKIIMQKTCLQYENVVAYLLDVYPKERNTPQYRNAVVCVLNLYLIAPEIAKDAKSLEPLVTRLAIRSY